MIVLVYFPASFSAFHEVKNPHPKFDSHMCACVPASRGLYRYLFNPIPSFSFWYTSRPSLIANYVLSFFLKSTYCLPFQRFPLGALHFPHMCSTCWPNQWVTYPYELLSTLFFIAFFGSNVSLICCHFQCGAYRGIPYTNKISSPTTHRYDLKHVNGQKNTNAMKYFKKEKAYGTCFSLI